jgi:hypothetical protein
MDNKKFEKLIDLIINEDEEQARELFHDIVVEKSREIYESIMDEEMGMEDDVEEGMGGQVGDLMDEISSEEAGGMAEDEDGMDGMDDLEGDDVVDIESDDAASEGGEVEDSVIRIEDKLDQLMAEFEQIMGGGGDDDMGDEEDMGGDDDMGDEEDMGGDDDMGDEEDMGEEMMEAVQLQNVKGLYGSKIGGDNGAQTKSPGLQNSGQAGMDSKPVTFSGQNEPVPTSPKNPSNYGTKGETQVKGAGQFKNAPGGNAGKTSFKDKAPRDWGKKDSSTGKEVGAGGSVAQNDKSPIAEARKTVKRIVR